MYVEALTPAQAEKHAELTKRAARVTDQFAELREELDTLYHDINIGPDLNDTGTVVLHRVRVAYTLLHDAEDLFGEAVEAGLQQSQ
jgi:hypothetical protein